MEANKSTSDFYTITQKSPETYLYSDESRQSSPLSDIPDSVGDNEHHGDHATPGDQLRMETEKWSYLQLNKGENELDIQPPDGNSKRSHQDRLADPVPGV